LMMWSFDVTSVTGAAYSKPANVSKTKLKTCLAIFFMATSE
jgi:hypothetical protein